MPELPEVETVRKSLEATVIGKKIADITVNWGNIIKHPQDSEQFSNILKGQTIRRLGRRGKFLLFYFDDLVLVSHLRMEGKYGVFSKEEPIGKHDHVIFKFSDATELRYKDVRKFGTMHVYPIGKEFLALPLSQVGPEPFSDEYTLSYLTAALKKTQRMIKPALLDQKIVVGLGNIYVDETLFRAGVHPEKICATLTKKEIVKIYEESKKTLAEAIDKGGTTIRSYVNSLGQIGLFQLELMVYGKAGLPCVNCGTELIKLKVGGRGTVICPECQKI